MLQLKFFELHCIKISWGLNAEPNFYHERKNVKLIKFFSSGNWKDGKKEVVIVNAIDNVIKS
jgi:hypothetical protein